jgi:hypothetical protein
MFIREIAALVADFKGISENISPLDGALSTACLLAVDDLLPFVLTIEECPWRRALKHEGQYTGLPWLGRKGRVADMPQSSQAAWCRVRLAGRRWAGEER